MSFRIELDPYEKAYARFQSHIRDAIQRTYEAAARDGLTQKELAETLDIDAALISRRLNGPGNVTLRTISDLFTAMGSEPLANFVAPATCSTFLVQGDAAHSIEDVQIDVTPNSFGDTLSSTETYLLERRSVDAAYA